MNRRNLMKRKNNFIPTLIAILAAFATTQSAQAQVPARQAFPWSSATVAQSASPAVSQARSHITASTQQFANSTETFGNSVSQSLNNTIGNVTSVANRAVSVGETIYLDESGNQITREQMQANLSGVQNLRQNFQNHIPSQSVDSSVWGKAKNITSKATSFWKRPSLLKTPEGLNLPSTKTTWGKPKFAEPTTWFSKSSASPITFAPIGSLPRKGEIPTSIDGPLTSPPAQLASRSSRPAEFSTHQSNSFDSTGEEAAESILSPLDYEVADKVDNSFDPLR